MFELGIDDIATPEARAKLAESLEVDLIMVPTVPYLGSKQQPKTLISAAGNAPEARVELALFSFRPDAPSQLFHGTDQATATTWNSAEGVVFRLFKGLIDRFFPKE